MERISAAVRRWWSNAWKRKANEEASFGNGSEHEKRTKRDLIRAGFNSKSKASVERNVVNFASTGISVGRILAA
jgi:hypothetical protein